MSAAVTPARGSNAPPQPARRSLDFAVRAMRAQVIAGASDGRFFAGAASDSRQVAANNLFFALKGERTDGFEHCAQAAAAGAAALVVAVGRGVPAGCEGAAVLAVPDPRLALGDLARAVRAEFRGKVVGVTGSNGKTTTKELIAAALASAGAVMRTFGSLNTEVGMPQTILGARGDEAFWVLEMAMRGLGEIAYLREIARPHVALVTNVAAAHLGRLGSLDEVARAKGEIYQDLGAEAIAVLPAGDARLEAQAAHLPEARKRRFGGWLEYVPAGRAGAVVRLAIDDQPLVMRLPFAGEHNARNAAAALTVAAALGVPLLPAAAALETACLPPHRSRMVAVGGRTVLDDCYNANPASMSAALATVTGSVGASGRALAVLGDMLELGDDAEELHAAAGREAVGRGLAGLAAVGALGAHIGRGAREAGLPVDRLLITDDPVDAAAAVAGWSRPGDWILVKASRGARLERAVSALEEMLAERSTARGRP